MVLFPFISPLPTDIRFFSFFISSYFGLISFWIGRETNDKKWIARGTESKEAIEKLSLLASTWNFQNSKF